MNAVRKATSVETVPSDRLESLPVAQQSSRKVARTGRATRVPPTPRVRRQAKATKVAGAQPDGMAPDVSWTITGGVDQLVLAR